VSSNMDIDSTTIIIDDHHMSPFEDEIFNPWIVQDSPVAQQIVNTNHQITITLKMEILDLRPDHSFSQPSLNFNPVQDSDTQHQVNGSHLPKTVKYNKVDDTIDSWIAHKELEAYDKLKSADNTESVENSIHAPS